MAQLHPSECLSSSVVVIIRSGIMYRHNIRCCVEMGRTAGEKIEKRR